MPARDVRGLPNRLANLVEDRLIPCGVESELVAAKKKAMCPVINGPTVDRAVVGIMVDYAKAIPHLLHDVQSEPWRDPLFCRQVGPRSFSEGQDAGAASGEVVVACTQCCGLGVDQAELRSLSGEKLLTVPNFGRLKLPRLILQPALFILVMLIAPAGFAQRPSVADQVRIAALRATEFEQGVTLQADPATLALVARVGQVLTRNSDAPFPVRFQVIDSPEINVVSVEGGFVYVTTGLIGAAASEAEFASAVAHGIARYSPKIEQSPMRLPIGSDRFLTFLPGFSLWQGPTVLESLSAISPVTAMQWAAREREAVERTDTLAVQILYKAGYDPTASVRFLQSLETRLPPFRKERESRLYPSLKDRIRKVEEWSRTKLLPRADNALTTTEFDRVRSNYK